MDRQNEGIEDAARLRLILLDMGGLLPQNEGKQDWPSYGDKTFPLAYLPDPRIAQIQADSTLQDVHKLYPLSKNQIEFVSRILVITGIFGHFQQKTFGEDIAMNEKQIILEAMKKAGEPLNAGKIAELTGLDRKLVDKAMADMKKDGSIVSPVRCKWEPAEK